MGNDSEDTLTLAGSRGSRGQGRSQLAFVLGDGAFGVPAATVKTLGKMVKHPSAVGAVRSASLRAPRIDRDDRRGDAEFFSAGAVMRLGIVSPIAEKSVNRQAASRLRDGRKETGSIIAGPVTHLQGRDQIGAMMRNNGDLGETPEAFHATGAGQKVPADVVAFQARGVDRGLRPLFDQAAALGHTENGGEESLQSPFFRSRSCAFWRVV